MTPFPYFAFIPFPALQPAFPLPMDTDAQSSLPFQEPQGTNDFFRPMPYNNQNPLVPSPVASNFQFWPMPLQFPAPFGSTGPSLHHVAPAQMTPSPLVSHMRGRPSHLAVQHLRDTGLQFHPLAMIQSQTQQHPPMQRQILHPAQIFPAAEDPEPRVHQLDSKFALIELQSLAKLLQKSNCAEYMDKKNRFGSLEEHRLGNELEESRCEKFSALSRAIDREQKALRRSYLRENYGPVKKFLGFPSDLLEKEEVSRSSSFDSILTNGPAELNENKEATTRPLWKTELLGAKFSGPPIRNGEIFSKNVPVPCFPRESEVGASLPYRFSPIPLSRPRRRISENFPNFHSDDRQFPLFSRDERLYTRDMSRNCNPLLHFQATDPSASILDKINEGPLECYAETSPQHNFKAGVVLTKRGYYCNPKCEELDEKTTHTGECVVSFFEVGHVEYGKIVFEEPMDVSGLDLDSIVEFGPKLVRVYPTGTFCPPIGQGLNRPATVILFNVFPTHRISKKLVKDMSKLRDWNYEDKLKQKAASYGGFFESYNPTTGEWKFRVSFFHPNRIIPF